MGSTSRRSASAEVRAIAEKPAGCYGFMLARNSRVTSEEADAENMPGRSAARTSVTGRSANRRLRSSPLGHYIGRQ